MDLLYSVQSFNSGILLHRFCLILLWFNRDTLRKSSSAQKDTSAHLSYFIRLMSVPAFSKIRLHPNWLYAQSSWLNFPIEQHVPFLSVLGLR